MATVNPTHPRARGGRKVADRAGIAPAMPDPCPSAAPRDAGQHSERPAPKRVHRSPSKPVIPRDVLAARHRLEDHEQAVIDAALAILGSRMREPGGAFASPDDVKAYLRLALAGERRELFGVLYLDRQSRVLAFETLFIGTLTQTSVYPREVARAALAHEADAVVLAHNHPSGNVQPSTADDELTQILKKALALVDVRVFDHIIVGGDQALSMAERGLL